MKKYEITELMREYTDEEFGIEGENAADCDKVLASVMGQVKPKKRMKPLFKVLAAAAAAVVLAGAVAAGTALTGSFTTITGRHVEYEFDYDEEGFKTGWARTTTRELEDVLTLQDGRLYFNINGESTDITDLIDRKTPYIYTYALPESEKPAYVIAGGTAEEYAVVDLAYTKGTGWYGIGVINSDAFCGYIDVSIDRESRLSEEPVHYNGYYWSDTDLWINYTVNSVRHFSYQETNMYPTWRDDADAWLIEALLQLELIELPKIENFELADVVVEKDRVLLWNNDITELISEEKAYNYRKFWSDKGEEEFVFIGGTPGNFGWAFIKKRLMDDGSFEYWTIADDNITDADGQLREWYLNAVEKREYDLEQLQNNYYFSE